MKITGTIEIHGAVISSITVSVNSSLFLMCSSTDIMQEMPILLFTYFAVICHICSACL